MTRIFWEIHQKARLDLNSFDSRAVWRVIGMAMAIVSEAWPREGQTWLLDAYLDLQRHKASLRGGPRASRRPRLQLLACQHGQQEGT